jgi:hypothetical protein
MTDRNSVPTDSCVLCGESTAVGTALFSDRRPIRTPEGDRFLCSLCDRPRASRRHRQRTEDEVRRYVETGRIVGIAWRE